MKAFMALCLKQLLAEVNSDQPHRDKSSDGWIGDTAHQQRHSDHNPDGRGCVCALDLTHDPKHFDSYRFAEMLREAKDRRLTYVISNKRIFYGHDHFAPWVWSTYHGPDPHTNHVHISVRHDKQYADNASPWVYAAPSASEQTAKVGPKS